MNIIDLKNTCSNWTTHDLQIACAGNKHSLDIAKRELNMYSPYGETYAGIKARIKSLQKVRKILLAEIKSRQLTLW